jgi:hypothetical protein
MFKDKNALISLAVAVVLAGCGGGGGDGGTPATASTTTTTTTSTTATTPPVVTEPVVVVDESLMQGSMTLVENLLMIDERNDLAFNLAQFNDTTRTPAGAYEFDRGTNAPIQSFALRLRPEQMDIAAGQTKVARLAFEMKDRAVGGVQALKVLVDQVEIAVSASNQFTVSVPATAKAYVYVVNKDGQSANVTASSLPANLVKLTTINGDTTSHGFTLDLNAAITAALGAAQGNTTALAAVNSIKDMNGAFDTNFTLSNVLINDKAGAPLVGASILVTGSGQPAVNGSGVKGIITTKAP